MANREALLEAGIACLHDKGYADTTARDIAGRADVSLGAIGYHFGSTDDLLESALAEAVRRWFEPLISLISAMPARVDRQALGACIDRLLETFEAHRPLVVAYCEALLRAQRTPELRSAMAADFDALRVAIATGIERFQTKQPESRRVDPEMSATLVMAVFDGLVIQWLLDPSRLPSGKSIADTLWRAAQVSVPVARPRRVVEKVGAE
ncbi:MAG: TetR/AcrR family transcriptional regulator [Acidimicrobiales bacterium]|nr:TetR/AcrR family transcriptional regulator [Acidimicrobiales bacterium]